MIDQPVEIPVEKAIDECCKLLREDALKYGYERHLKGIVGTVFLVIKPLVPHLPAPEREVEQPDDRPSSDWEIAWKACNDKYPGHVSPEMARIMCNAIRKPEREVVVDVEAGAISCARWSGRDRRGSESETIPLRGKPFYQPSNQHRMKPCRRKINRIEDQGEK